MLRVTKLLYLGVELSDLLNECREIPVLAPRLEGARWGSFGIVSGGKASIYIMRPEVIEAMKRSPSKLIEDVGPHLTRWKLVQMLAFLGLEGRLSLEVPVAFVVKIQSDEPSSSS